jgi:hypothetical protein
VTVRCADDVSLISSQGGFGGGDQQLQCGLVSGASTPSTAVQVRTSLGSGG